jgi:hypothetical protein
MRWFHEGVDRLHVRLLRVLTPRAFRHGITSPPFHAHLAAIRLALPPLTTARRYTLTADTLVGPLSAAFQIHWGPQPELPVLLYHHGIAEMPYDRTFRSIFWRRERFAAHLIAVRAPFHRSWLEVTRGMATLSNFLAMCAVSVALMETLRQALLARGARRSLLTGCSLGGVLVMLHHLVYGTADGYVPLLAGPDMAHVLLAAQFRSLVAVPVLAQPAPLQALLDFRQAFQTSDTSKVFPLLARYDLNMLYTHHQACYAARNMAVATIDRGHITGGLAFAALRAHILTCLASLGQDSQAGKRPYERESS